MRTIKTVCDRCGYDSTDVEGGVKITQVQRQQYAAQTSCMRIYDGTVAFNLMGGQSMNAPEHAIHICSSCVSFVKENIGAILIKGLKRD